jgi:uncharacterized protein YodC (DUF2158 family)
MLCIDGRTRSTILSVFDVFKKMYKCVWYDDYVLWQEFGFHLKGQVTLIRPKPWCDRE